MLSDIIFILTGILMLVAKYLENDTKEVWLWVICIFYGSMNLAQNYAIHTGRFEGD